MKVKGAQLCPTLCDPMDYSVHENSPSQNTGFPSPGDRPNPGIEPRSPALQADALPSEPPGKPLIIAQVCNQMSISSREVR